jgi:NAD(P)-dependent dehydrogenase (short-subunit alcohol dehydrogenase family)
MSYLDEIFGVAGKSVLVTGGSRGIGLAIAEGFVKAGARVYISSRDAAVCDEAVAELSKFGTCVALPANAATKEGRQQLVDALKAHESKLDVLINNAGAIWAAPFAEYPESGWDKVFDLNVKAVFFLTQLLLPMLEAAASAEDPARIINIGSMNVLRIPTHETYAYVASKAALHQMTRHLAGQIASRHINANVIAPGLYPSKMQVAMIEKKGLETLVAPIPMKRLANDVDMAAAAIYLASKAGAYLTGAEIPVDGGTATTI